VLRGVGLNVVFHVGEITQERRLNSNSHSPLSEPDILQERRCYVWWFSPLSGFKRVLRFLFISVFNVGEITQVGVLIYNSRSPLMNRNCIY